MALKSMHVTSSDQTTGLPAASSGESSRNPSFKMKLPTLDVQDFSGVNNASNTLDNDDLDTELATMSQQLPLSPGAPAPLKSPTTLTPPHCTPRSVSPVGRSPAKTPTGSHSPSSGSFSDGRSGSVNPQKHLLQVCNKVP